MIYGGLDTISGGYLYDRMLVDYLRRQGEEVEIITFPWRGYANTLTDNFSPALYKRLSQVNVDVLLQDELNHPSLFWLNNRLKNLKLPGNRKIFDEHRAYWLVSIVHHLRSSENHPGWQMKLYRWVERRYLSSVDGFIFNSQTTRRAVEAFVGSGHPALVAYPSGDQFQAAIAPAEIESRAHQDGPLRLLFVGNIIPRKGLHTLLEAVCQLPVNTATLTVIGDGNAESRYSHAIKKQVVNNKLQNRVQFLGQLSKEALAAQVRTHHIMAVPSTYEGYGIVYLEGMSFGLPAIGTTSGAASEIITHGQDGFLITPGNHTALSNYLIEIHHDRSRLAEMSKAARQHYLAQPSWDETGAAIHDFLKDLVRERSFET